jgi:adenosylcobinamide kinase/adenosylcobinamide-phosphate guanylyltransferase
MLTLITGGARSGKSTFAQNLCRDAQSVTYIATAVRTDAEMEARIDKHRSDRPSTWQTIEEPLAVPEAVIQAASADAVLLDCVTLWLSNLFSSWRTCDTPVIEQNTHVAVGRFIQACSGTRVIAVTNEVGSGIVPESAVARLFRDLQGMANQQLAHAAEAVYLLTAGISLRIK